MKSKIISALIAVAVALGVWLYVVTVISPNSDKSFHNIEVNMEGEALLNDQGLMVTNPEISTATLHLEGSRVDLNKLNSENIILNVDVSKISAPGTHDLPYSIDFKDMSANAFTFLDKKPGTVKVMYSENSGIIYIIIPLEQP